jgi:frataxin-like iron-binding protein CyaY
MKQIQDSNQIIVANQPSNQYRIGYYIPMKTYSRYKVTRVLDSLGINIELPKLNRQILVINTSITQVYLAKDSKGYHFRETGIRLHTQKSKLESNLAKVTTESVKIALGIKH